MGVPFPKSVVQRAFRRIGGLCECIENHKKCANKLVWNRRSFKGPGGWEVKPVDYNGLPSLENCQIFCTRCFKMYRRKILR